MAGESIIFIEPNDYFAEIILYNLRKLKYTVHRVTTGEAALSKIEAERRVALAIIDSLAENVSGIAICEKIKAAHSSVPVILLLPTCTKDDVIKIARLRVNGYITFPFQVEDLIQKIDEVLGNSKNYSVITVGGKVIVSLSGHIDHFFTPKLKNVFNEINSNGQYNIILDLTETAFLGHQNLVVLTSAMVKMRHLGGDIKLVVPHQEILDMLKEAKLSNDCKIYATRSEALRGD